jgi:hypothetical protein
MRIPLRQLKTLEKRKPSTVQQETQQANESKHRKGNRTESEYKLLVGA